MDTIDIEDMYEAAEDAADVLRALSNSSRLMILCALVDGPKRVGDLEAGLRLGQAYVSQQLARLRSEGLVTASRDGRAVYYEVTDPRIKPILRVIYDQFCAPKTSQ